MRPPAGSARSITSFAKYSSRSRSETPALVRACGLPLLSLPCNLGYARALQTGLRYALERGLIGNPAEQSGG